MWSFARLRSHPQFAHLFAHVHPLCWLILWWQLNVLIRFIYRDRPDDVLYSVSEWGIVRIRRVAPRTDPDLYTPLPRTFRPLSDASWESALPSNLEAPCIFILPRLRGRWPEGPEGALPSHLCYPGQGAPAPPIRDPLSVLA